MSRAQDEAGRQPRRYIDWNQAARLMAEGQAPAAAAAALGISENRLWRHFETSSHFRGLILRAAERRRCLALALQAADDGANAPDTPR
ncbi:hypothetical protein [Ferrovibrio sp.]|uniref:hypothetical protein n=1 Tax=Ferrovibrio sp. TaxID=1917215 RepID=UPI00260369F8|nr:hypothetical protein [Ferrovibrio sp.]